MRFFITSLLFLFSLNLVGQEIKTPPRQLKEGAPGDVMTTNQAGVVHRRAAILVDTQFVASYVAGDIVKVSTTGTMYRAVIPATYPFNVNDAAWFPVDTRLLAGEVQAFEADATALAAIAPSWSTAAVTAVDTKITLYGIAPVYTSANVPVTASTTSATTLHQYYLTKTGANYRVRTSGAIQVTATFAYTAGQTYYLNDAGDLSTTSDADFDSAVLYVVASLGSNQYILNLSDPRHFAN